MSEINKDNMITDKGVYKTMALFLEVGQWDSSAAVYSLRSDKVIDGKILPCIRTLYVEMEDVHEYDFANRYFLGWAHWQKICESPELQKHIQAWRDELEIRLRSKAMRQMKQLAEEGDRTAVRYLADRGWSDAPKPKRGRPSKEEVAGELKKEAAIRSRANDDAARIGLVK